MVRRRCASLVTLWELRSGTHVRAHVYAWLCGRVCGCSMCFSAQRGHMDVVVAAGQERFASLARMYFRDAVGALLAFDMTSRKSFESVGRWVKRAHSLASQRIVVLLVANKSDLAHRRKVSVRVSVALQSVHCLHCRYSRGCTVGVVALSSDGGGSCLGTSLQHGVH